MFAIALGANRKCRNTINDIYRENERVYYEEYKNSDLFNNKHKDIFSLNTEDAINKLIGIIEHCLKNEQFLKLEKIIKDVHPLIIKYVKKSTTVIDIDAFHLKYIQPHIYEYSEQEILSVYLSLIFISNIYEKMCIGGAGDAYINTQWNRIHNITLLHDNIKDTDYNNQDYSEKISKNYKLFDLEPFENVEKQNLSLFIENFIEKRTWKELNRINIFEQENSVEIYENTRTKQFNTGILKYIGSYSRFLEFLGIDDMDIFVDVNIDNDIINFILKDFELAKQANNFSEEEIEAYVGSGIMIYGLSEMYTKAKNLYLNKSKEDKYCYLKKFEKDLEKYKEELNLKEKSLSDDIEKKNKRIQELEEKNKLLSKENSILRSDNIKTRDMLQNKENENKSINEEKDMLLSVIKQFEMLNSADKEASLDEMIDYINRFNIGLFGGIDNTEKLTSKLKNIRFYKTMTRDISSIKNLDMIFINTDFFSHSFGKKTKSNKNKYNVPSGYIGGTNENFIIKQIYSLLKSEYK